MGNDFSFDRIATAAFQPSPHPPSYPTSIESACLQHIQNSGTTKFDRNSERHMALLQKLWDCWYSFDDDEVGDQAHRRHPPPLEMPSKLWRSIGFQHEDPISDVRGGAELSITNLAYFAESYPATLLGIRRAKKRRYREIQRADGIPPSYPIAPAGINITRLLTEIFNILEPMSGTPKWFCQEMLPYYRFLAAEAAGRGGEGEQFCTINPTTDYFKMGERAFNELYCFVFQYLDRKWDLEEASYMDFNRILVQVKEDIVALLTSAPPHAGLWWLRMQTGIFIDAQDFNPFSQSDLSSPKAHVVEQGSTASLFIPANTSSAGPMRLSATPDLVDLMDNMSIGAHASGGMVLATSTF